MSDDTTCYTCEKCGGTGWIKTEPLECTDGRLRCTRVHCPCQRESYLAHLQAEVERLCERVRHLEELNRRLDKYASFGSVGYISNGSHVVVECNNCLQARRMTPLEYEQLQRQSHERNSRIDA